MMRFVCLDFLAATGTTETVVAGIDITKTYLCFQVPMPAQNPGITVADAQTTHPTLVAVIGKFGKISAPKRNAIVHACHVELPRMEVKPQKMAGKAVAKPITRLGLDKPMLPPTSVRESPGIEIACDVERPFRRQSYLQAQVDIGKSVIKHVGLYRHMLSIGGEPAKQEDTQ